MKIASYLTLLLLAGSEQVSRLTKIRSWQGVWGEVLKTEERKGLSENVKNTSRLILKPDLPTSSAVSLFLSHYLAKVDSLRMYWRQWCYSFVISVKKNETRCPVLVFFWTDEMTLNFSSLYLSFNIRSSQMKESWYDKCARDYDYYQH